MRTDKENNLPLYDLKDAYWIETLKTYEPNEKLIDYILAS